MNFAPLLPLVPAIIPLAAGWVRRQETAILANGVALSSSQLEDARRAGVSFPEKIRLKIVPVVPMPLEPVLRELADRIGLLGSRTAGLTLGHGIFIRNDGRNSRELLIHECVHVAQYERLGSIEDFLRPYLQECISPGYPLGPMEQEAIVTTARIMREL